MNSRPCERCGVTLNLEYSIQSANSYDPMCMEVVLAYGILAWLCFDCRKDWHKVYKSHRLSKEYSEASIRLEHWRSLLTAGKDVQIDDGIKLWSNIDSLEMRLNNYANEWLIKDLD